MNKAGRWLQKDFADPLRGWNIDEIISLNDPNVRQLGMHNDLYGHLTLRLRAMLSKLYSQLRKSNLDVMMYCMDLQRMPAFVGSVMDRIEVSNVMDRAYLGVGPTLKACRPLLRKDRKHATVISLFMNAIPEIEDIRKRQGNTHYLRAAVTATSNFLDFPASSIDQLGPYHPEMIRFMNANSIFAPFDEWWRTYADLVQMSDEARANEMTIRSPNEITSEWPFRLRKLFGQYGAQDDFDKILESESTGSQRYVEWIFVDGN